MFTAKSVDGVRVPSKRPELLAVQTTLIGFAFIVVSLRLITRFCVVKKPGKDDYAIIFATARPLSRICWLTVVADYHTGHGYR